MSSELCFHEFDAGYHRKGFVSLQEQDCDKCKRNMLTVYMDGSEGEYGGCHLCLNCIMAAVGRWASGERKEPSY